MIYGIGVDLVELERIKEILTRQEKFPKRILTPSEYKRYNQLSAHRQIEFLAGRFAAKEAFSKAMGTGIGHKVSFQDLEVLPNKKNKPIAKSTVFSGGIHVSISHSKIYAIAQILLEDGNNEISG